MSTATTAVAKRLTGTELIHAGKQAKGHIDAAARHKDKAEDQYKAAGRYLVEAKYGMPHGKWLSWLKEYDIAERTARRCIQFYEDPIAHESRKEANREYNAKVRPNSNRTVLSDLKSGHQAADPTQEACDDCNTDEERWQRSCANFLGDLLAMRAYWKREFGQWEKFERPSSLVTLAKQATEEWTKLAKSLTGEH